MSEPGFPDNAGPRRTAGPLHDRVHSAFLVLDGAGRVVLRSPEVERFLPRDGDGGLALGRLLGLREDHRGPGPRRAEVMRVRRADCPPRSVELRGIRLHDGDDKEHVLVQVTDADEQDRVERDLALWKSMVDQAAVGLAVFDTDLRWLMVNPALERINGLPQEAVVGRRIGEVLPALNAGAVESRMRQVLRTGEPLLDQVNVGRTAADPDHDHAWSESWYRLEDLHGRILGLVVAVIDVTERHRAEQRAAQARQRLAVVADAGARIGTTLDLRRTARELAEVATPQLADLAAVELLESALTEGLPAASPTDRSLPFRTLAVAGESPVGAAHPVGERLLYDASRVAARCVTERQPVLLAHLREDMILQVAGDDRAAMVLAKAKVHSVLAVPLIARGEVLGAVTLYRTDTPRPFDEQDLALARELASRAAVSIDNARLYGRERATALTLQRSLLPSRPPECGVEVAARYLPAVSEVGGDWYDVLRLGDDKVGLVVGDVMGKGVHAAAIMGQLRTATGVLARLDLPPAELLRRLDDTMTGLGEVIVTCLYAVYDPRARRCELASAGHLPPILVSPGGEAESVDIPPAVPLGVGGVPFGSRELDLAGGGTLAMFTDGLVEHPGHIIDVGLERVMRTLAGGGPLEGLADGLLRPLGGDPADDVALLLARMP